MTKKQDSESLISYEKSRCFSCKLVYVNFLIIDHSNKGKCAVCFECANNITKAVLKIKELK